VLGLGPSQLAAAAEAGGHLSEAAVRAVTGRRPGEITAQEYDLVTDPAHKLTRRAATRRAARRWHSRPGGPQGSAYRAVRVHCRDEHITIASDRV